MPDSNSTNSSITSNSVAQNSTTPCAETEAVAAVVRSYNSEDPILAAYFRPLDFTPPPGNWAHPELVVIPEGGGDIMQRYRPFSRLEIELMDKGINCVLKIYTPEEITKSSIPARFQNLVA